MPEGVAAAAAPLASLTELAAATAEEATGLDRELAEIEMLIGQARTEAERHESRRFQAEETGRKIALGTSPGDPAEAQAALVTSTRRAVMMQAQVEILEGKRRALTRYRDRARELAASLGALAAEQPSPAAGEAEDDASAPSPMSGPEAQESLRREIARQMHDGPAQSLTNITLQAQIVQRLVGLDDARAQAELAQLVGMVQQTLEATKTFIFDVRPMVLDDLGLLPTLRRAVRERAQRSHVAVDLDGSGVDRRLSAELESALFRIVDEAILGFLTTGPAGIQVRLDWTETSVEAMVRAVRSDGRPAAGAATGIKAGPAASAPTPDVPAALAAMIRDQSADAAERREAAIAAQAKATALPESTWRAIQVRARGARVQLSQSEAGRRLDIHAETGPPGA